MPYGFQRVVAWIGVLALSPLFAAVALAARLSHGAPVLYSGTRYGLGGQPFDQLKFRSMVVDADALLDEHGQATSERVTSFGRFVRRTSIDELPQLINVARGEMAFVGPRPLIEKVHSRVDPDHPRFSVVPGITGLAQVNGRNFLPWSQRLDFDAEYVRTRSSTTDLKLLFVTARRVLTGQDIAPDRNPGEVLDI